MSASHAMIGVIPTLFVAGPLAIFAVLFPGLAAAVMLVFRRWSSAFVVLSLNSSLLLLHSWFLESLHKHWWGGFMFLWITIGVVSLLGMIRSMRRARKQPDAPRGGTTAEWAMICIISVITLGGAAYCIIYDRSMLDLQQRALLVLLVATWITFVFMSLVPPRPAKESRLGRLSPETVMLCAIGVTSISVTLFTYFEEALNDEKVKIVWTFEPNERGAIYSSSVVQSDGVYTATVHTQGMTQTGAVYCLDRYSGDVIWKFDDGGAMKPVFSSPCVQDGRLFVGEGFHQHTMCKLYCIDARKGHKLWEFVTTGHTESSPAVVDGRVYFGAGDDGMYCVDAATGQELWHFAGPHVDGKPAVSDGRVYAGSGYGNFEVFCLDARTGEALWRRPVELPSFGSPTVEGERVYFGIGNGNFIGSDAQPAGALLCMNAKNGDQLWRYDAPDAIHAKPVVGDSRVFLSCRDHHFYCLDSETGQMIWKRDLGSFVVTEPILTTNCRDRGLKRIYVLASGGVLYCLDFADGSLHWSRNLQESHAVLGLFISTPSVEAAQSEHGCHHRIYVGASGFGRAMLYCLDECVDK